MSNSKLAQRGSHLIKIGTWQMLGIAAVILAGCGGGAGEGEPSPVPAPVPVPIPVPAPPGPADQDRINAATQTANTNPACSSSAMPEGFYWEIGDTNGSRASGSVSGTNTPTASQVIAIASSSKWIYSTYVLQKVGSVRASDVPFLQFTSGYVFPPSKPPKRHFAD